MSHLHTSCRWPPEAVNPAPRLSPSPSRWALRPLPHGLTRSPRPSTHSALIAHGPRWRDCAPGSSHIFIEPVSLRIQSPLRTDDCCMV
jgi:hypothetical protein